MLKKDTESLRRYLLMCLIVLTMLVIAILLHRFGPPLARDWLGFLGIVIFPFAFAWVAAVFMRPLAESLSRRLRLSPTLSVLAVMLICLAALGLIVLALALVVVGVTSELLLYFSDPDNSLTVLFARLQYLYAQLDIDFDQLQRWLSQLYSSAGDLAGQGLGWAVNIVKATPTALLLVVVSLVAMFYWCRDEETVKRVFCTPFAPHRRRAILSAYDSLSRVIGHYLRAQVLLVSISIMVCVAGLSIMRLPNAVPMGLLAGILDIIPMLGPGTVLLPWAVWLIITGQFFAGLGLFVVFVAVILIRNMIQPKILGDQVGLHPLVALASLFIGMELFGVVGLFLGPVAAAMFAALYRERKPRPPVFPPKTE